MPTHLDKILSRTLLSVLDRKKATPLIALELRAGSHTPRGFAAALRASALRGPAVIAELKKASPSRGLLRAHYVPAAIAKTYAAAGASCISVLTDEDFFKGSLADLTAVSREVMIPVLRKDFILDPYQIVEARAFGADAVLLIVAALSDPELRVLARVAREMQLDVLCEVHDREELERAVALGVHLIGVNCRNLKTLQVNPQTHHDLARYLPPNVLRVAESGIRSSNDIDRLLSVGYDAFLVGEALMRQPEPAAALALLTGFDYASEL